MSVEAMISWLASNGCHCLKWVQACRRRGRGLGCGVVGGTTSRSRQFREEFVLNRFRDVAFDTKRDSRDQVQTRVAHDLFAIVWHQVLLLPNIPLRYTTT